MKVQKRRQAIRQEGGKNFTLVMLLIFSVIFLAVIVGYYRKSNGTNYYYAYDLVDPYLKEHSEADVVNFEMIRFHENYVYPVNYYFQIFPIDSLDFVKYFNLSACSLDARESSLQYDACDFLGMNISAHGARNLLPNWWKSSGRSLPIYAKLFDRNSPKRKPDFTESWDGKFLVYFCADTANICVELLMK